MDKIDKKKQTKTKKIYKVCDTISKSFTDDEDIQDKIKLSMFMIIGIIFGVVVYKNIKETDRSKTPR